MAEVAPRRLGLDPTLVLLLLCLAPQAMAARQRTGNIDVLVVLDESGSMKPIFQRVTAYIGDALVRGYLEPGDYLCILGFSDVPHVRVSQRLSSTHEKENLAQIVHDLNVVPQGYTDIGRALEETLRQLGHLADPSHQQVVLILTDGLNQPPRDSPYFSPLRPDTGRGLAPPSRFTDAFLAQVQRLASAGWRIHVVGIGLETDAKALAEALGAGHTVLREFNPQELEKGLGNFWDETINLTGLDPARREFLPGSELIVTARIRSASDRDREVHLRGVRVTKLTLLSAGGHMATAEPASVRVSPTTQRWAVPAHKEAAFEVRLALPEAFPAGDFTATLDFDQGSAVRFYPPQGTVSFHVPSFWERHASQVVLSSTALLTILAAGLLYRRRPLMVALVVDGQPPAESARPVRLGIAGFVSLGGGAADRFRIPGLPQKVALLERRAVGRFSLVSSKPELVPTILEYALGDTVEIRTGGAPADRLQVRFVRWKGRAAGPRPRTPLAPASPSTPRPPAGGIDFR